MTESDLFYSGDQIRDLMLEGAALDRAVNPDHIQPAAAFISDYGLTLAHVTLRPFARGEHLQAFIELEEFARLLGAGRIIALLGGRAWSTADPIPPVSDDGDMRQRVTVIHDVTRRSARTDLYTDETSPPVAVIEERCGALDGMLHDHLANMHPATRGSDAEVRLYARLLEEAGHSVLLYRLADAA